MTIFTPKFNYVFAGDLEELVGGTFTIKKSEDGNIIVAIEKDTDKIHTLAILQEEVDPAIALNNHIIAEYEPDYRKETFIPKPHKHRYLGLARKAGKMTPKEK